jgi:hypothetical protein
MWSRDSQTGRYPNRLFLRSPEGKQLIVSYKSTSSQNGEKYLPPRRKGREGRQKIVIDNLNYALKVFLALFASSWFKRSLFRLVGFRNKRIMAREDTISI